MNDAQALIPAVVAAGGGSALMGSIVFYEYRREAQMRASRQAYSVIFPIGTTPEAAEAALKSLSGLNYTFELVSEVVADETGIHHLLHVPERVAASVIDQLSAAMPGIRLDPVEARPTGVVTTATRITVPINAALRSDDAVSSTRALLGGLGALRDGERLSLRWALRPSSAPTPADNTESPRTPRAKIEERSQRQRLTNPGFALTGLLLVRAPKASRAHELSGHVVSILRSRRSIGNGLMMRRAAIRSGTLMPGTGRRRGWLSVPEVVGLLGWPLGDQAIHGVDLGAARRISVPRGVSSTGRRLLVGRDAYGERDVGLTAEAARHHLAVVGPSGTGKSVLLARGILDDLEAGYGGVLVDPKSDLVRDVLDRVPPRQADRVVVLDPASGGRVPGLNLMSVGDPDLRADVVLSVLRSLFRDSWGIRTDQYLRLGLRTLGELPEPMLTDWLRLFADVGFRREAVARLRDPLLVAAWQSYESLSLAEQQQHVAAPMSKVISLLSRPQVRAVLAQRQPRLDIPRLLAERKWLLVALSPGTLGQPASQLLGAIVTFAVWTAIEARSAVPPEQRRPVFLYLDELQSVSELPFGLEYFFERTRGLGCGVTVATQALGRLPHSLQQSLLGNVGSLISFRLGYDEAVRVSRELPGLDGRDLQALRPFEVAARISTGAGSSVTVVTGRTEPLHSAQSYGQDPASIDEELRDRQDGATGSDAGIGRGRRA